MQKTLRPAALFCATARSWRFKGAHLRCGIIILTDLDGAGQRIRSFLRIMFSNVQPGFVLQKDARTPMM